MATRLVGESSFNCSVGSHIKIFTCQCNYSVPITFGVCLLLMGIQHIINKCMFYLNPRVADNKYTSVHWYSGLSY